jgi:hypothetical protein
MFGKRVTLFTLLGFAVRADTSWLIVVVLVTSIVVHEPAHSLVARRWGPSMLRGNAFGGLWMFLIGTFLGHAATLSYQQLLIRQALEGEPVHRFMEPNPVTVPPTLTIEELVEGYMYTYHLQMFPVVDYGGEVAWAWWTTRISFRPMPRSIRAIPAGDCSI